MTFHDVCLGVTIVLILWKVLNQSINHRQTHQAVSEIKKNIRKLLRYKNNRLILYSLQMSSIYSSDDSAVYLGDDEYMDCLQPGSVSSQFSGASTSPHSSG